MAEPDVMEEKEPAVANVTSTCDKRHCKEMRKEKLPPYLRDRGTKLLGISEKYLSHKKTIFLFIVYYDRLNFMIHSP